MSRSIYTRAEWDGSDDPSGSGFTSAWRRDRYVESVGRL